MSRWRLAPFLLVLGGTAAFPAPALSGWSVDPVTVRPTTSSIPLVAACTDAGAGTFVIWQEEATAGTGLLRAQHLLGTGDLDPAWPIDGALVSDGVAARTDLGAFPDRLGGVFLWWTEPNSAGPWLYLTRLAPNGSVGAGWPARGRLVGTISNASPAPRALSDDTHGVFLAWAAQGLTTTTIIKVVHLGITNTGVNGWPVGPRTVVPDDGLAINLWPQIALSPDGGLFVAWASWSQDETTQPSAYRMLRLTSAGLVASGWPVEGIELSAFHPAWIGDPKIASLLAISADGRGGVWALIGDATSPGPYANLRTRLDRLQGDGSTAPDWPSAGLDVGGPAYYPYSTPGAWSYRAASDGSDGVIVGMPETCADCGQPLGFSRVSAGGASSSLGGGPCRGLEGLVREDGGFDLAALQPSGPTGPYQPNAFIAFSQTGGPGFGEWHPEPSLHWYGDVALASYGPSGAVFFWSQVRERFGLFARRFGLAGEVTGVGSGAKSAGGIHDVRFVPGRGVVAGVDLADGSAELRLFDLAGRLVSARSMEGSGRVEVAMPSTTGISSGLYFARLTSALGRQSRKVVVAR